MSNELVLWNSPNAVTVPSSFDCGELMDISKRSLREREVNQIVTAYNSGLYDMSIEYAWIRTIGIIRKKLSSLGNEFIAEMLDRASESNFTIDSVSEYDSIKLATDLGLIDDTANKEFLHISDMLRHYREDSDAGELDNIKTLSFLKDCVKFVLGKSDDKFIASFSDFRNKFKEQIFSSLDQEIETLKLCPYFYKRTVLRALLNLSKTTTGAELEKVLANLISVTPEIWDDIFANDRYYIGQSYSIAVNEGNLNLSKALKQTLLKVKGFDYVPENLRSNTFFKTAQDLLNSHYAMNNFHTEPAKARELHSLGSVIPKPALSYCLTAILACKLGNHWGISNAAQIHLDSILTNITIDKWEYYFNEILPGDDKILTKLADSNTFHRWVDLISEYNLSSERIDSLNIKAIIESVIENNSSKCVIFAKKALKMLRNK